MGLISPFIQPFLPPSHETEYIPHAISCQMALIPSYGFYLGHFLLTFLLPSPRAFRILMVVLVVAVTLNLTGCLMAVHFHLMP